jgi:hypothetical protein
MNLEELRTGLKSTYQDNNKAEKELKAKGYTLDKSLSGQRAKVFVDDETGQAYVAHRGTKGTQDYITDAKLMMGIKDSKRLEHGKQVRKQAEAKYGTVDSIGHSYGGFVAENSGNEHGKIITYNKASRGDKNKNIKQTDIRTSNDIISFLTPKHKNNITLKSKTSNPYKEHITDSLKRHKNIIFG